ncbi:unnamed protein product, partial [Gulo gulo]
RVEDSREGGTEEPRLSGVEHIQALGCLPAAGSEMEDSNSQACLGCRIQGGRRGRDALSDNPTRSAHGVGEVIPQKDP